MTEKQRFKAKLAGKTYTIVGDRTPEHLTAVTALINQQFQQLKDAAPELSVADCCMLMAVNAVSDQLLKEARIVELEAQLNQPTKKTTNKLKKAEQIPFKR